MLASAADLAVYGVAVASEVADRFIAVADEWVRQITGRDWELTGAQTKTFYNVREGDLLFLPDPSPTGVTIQVFETGAPGRTLTSSEWTTGSDGQIFLYRFGLPFQNPLAVPRKDIGVQEAINTIDRPIARRYEHVDVAYTASGTVPATVREAVAMIAAASIQQAPQLASQMRSERIGDYSYERAGGGGMMLSIPEQALEWLQEHAARPFSVAGKMYAAHGQQVW